MRVFDWRELLDKERIPYIERGANVKRGELNVRCPFCASADPSYHMGINLESGWFSCWRAREQHSGKSPVRLIMALTHVTWKQAREMAGLSPDFIDPEGFTEAVARMRLGRGVASRPETVKPALVFPPHFLPIRGQANTLRWFNYLFQRGFARSDIVRLCGEYELSADRGESRLILPYIMDDKLVSWTGRAITPATIRYKDLEIDESIVAPKHTLFNHDATLIKAKLLVIVEGPMDALKVDYYGREYGVRAVALSTNSISDEQVYLLEDAATRFDKTVVLMDNKTGFGSVDGMRMRARLGTIPDIETMAVPFGAPDPGDLTPDQVDEWSRRMTQGRRR